MESVERQVRDIFAKRSITDSDVRESQQTYNGLEVLE
jgi:hypothetical protein